MKRKKQTQNRLVLGKETITDLSREEKKALAGGEAPTMVGMSCVTDVLCCITTDNP